MYTILHLWEHLIMTNSTNGSTWEKILVRNGLAGLGLMAMGFVIYTFVLIPSAKERDAFTKTSIRNAESMDQVADSTKDISASVERQEATMANLNEEIEKQSKMREVAMKTMSAFAKEMREINPANAEKLDLLMDYIMQEDHWDTKLDILIEHLKQAHPEIADELDED